VLKSPANGGDRSFIVVLQLVTPKKFFILKQAAKIGKGDTVFSGQAGDVVCITGIIRQLYFLKISGGERII